MGVGVVVEGVTQGAEADDEAEDDERRDDEDEDLGRFPDITHSAPVCPRILLWDKAGTFDRFL